MTKDTKTLTLTEFLLARIAEDEAVARATESERFVAYVDDCDWHVEAEGVSHLANFGRETWPLVGEQVAHIARHDPARVLAECEAKRRIMDEHYYMARHDSRDFGFEDGNCITCRKQGPCATLRHLAAIYADHPDFDESWRP